MTGQAPVLIVVIPLIFAFFCPLLGLLKKNICYPWAAAGILLSTAASAITMATVLETGKIHYRLGSWAPPWGIEYVIDHLNGAMLLIIGVIAFLITITSKRSVVKENPEKEIYFYTLLLLQVTGFLGIVVTGDLFNLYVFIEIASISGYALIAIGKEHAAMASFRYIIMGTVGACFYLMGVGYLYSATGTLNMADLADILPRIYHSKAIITAFSFLIVGISVKMALPPLHAWLSDAYYYAPSAAGSLTAPLMTKIAVYMLIRIMLSVFDPEFYTVMYPVNDILGWIAVFGILFAGIMALAQTEFKRMLTYLIMAEMGYIMIGIASGNEYGSTGAILHVINDIFMTACLFTVAGAVFYVTGAEKIKDLRFLHRKMPVTSAILVTGALAVIGIPPFCGFFSKWYLILGAIESGKWILLAALLISSLINAVLFFRVLECVYVEPREEGEHIHFDSSMKPNEAPLSMLIPMLMIALGIISLGFFSNTIVENVISYVTPF